MHIVWMQFPSNQVKRCRHRETYCIAIGQFFFFFLFFPPLYARKKMRTKKEDEEEVENRKEDSAAAPKNSPGELPVKEARPDW